MALIPQGIGGLWRAQILAQALSVGCADCLSREAGEVEPAAASALPRLMEHQEAKHNATKQWL